MTGGWGRRSLAVAIVGALAVITPGAATAGAQTSESANGDLAAGASASAAFEGFGSVREAYALGAEPDQELVVVDASDNVVGSAVVNDLGGVIVRDVAPGDGYTFQSIDGEEVSNEFSVLAPDDHPDAAFYEAQDLDEGLNYITMRDGIELAATVRLPPGASLDDGPFPTVIEYSGYATAAPGDLLGSFLNPGGVDPNLPLPSSSTAVGGALAPLLGFASVSLQMRGTGCSGGAFGLLDTIAALDGYDAIETVATQPWVKDNRVGLVGISYSGISQVIVAGTQPPSLAGITPLAVTDDLYSTGFPGGIRNDGFAEGWLADRIEDAKPAHEGGQPWARTMINLGDENCAANQALHGSALDIDDVLGSETARVPHLYDERSPEQYARNIDVPTFMVGALQDEQTGGQWPNLIPALDGNDDVWITVINGTHVDPMGPGTIGRMIEFLDLFVADVPTTFNAGILILADLLYEELAGTAAGPVTPLRFQDAPSTDAARDEFRNDPRIRVLFDNGGGNPSLGALAPQWEAGFDAWPPSDAAVTELFLADGGALTDTAPTSAREVSWNPDPAARPRNSLPPGADPWAALPNYNWQPVTGDIGVGFTTDPLDDDLVLVGPATLELALRSTSDDTDLQVTVSEVRPDGQEMYVQSGFLRASHRALDDSRSTELFSMPTYTLDDAAPLRDGEFTSVRVPLGHIAHAFREGSQLRITITAPGGDRPEWTFETFDTGGAVTNTIALGGDQPSRLILPVAPGVEPGSTPPPCPSLRGQPCRDFEPADNEIPSDEPECPSEAAPTVRGAGFWQNEFRNPGARQVDEATLLCYLDAAHFMSEIFGEQVPLDTPPDAAAALRPGGGGGDPRVLLDRQILAGWLNFASGAYGLDDLVDTTGDGVANSAFGEVMHTAESVRLNPDSTRQDLVAQKDTVETLNQPS